jgi:hypothetical protein
MPAIGVLLQLGMVPVTRYMYAGHIVTVSPLSVFTPEYFLLLGVACLLYAATVVLAYFDWRRLRQEGILRPFHWAWGYLPAVYIIGRTITVQKAVSRRALWPVFYLIAVLLTGATLSVFRVSSVPPWLGHAGL